MPRTTKEATATGHKCTTTSNGSMASAAPPTEPQTSLKRLTQLPHAVAVTRICARRDGAVFSTASDSRICLTGVLGRPSLPFGDRGGLEVDGWLHDLELVEDRLLCGAGALATKVWDAQTGAQVASLQGHQGATRCISGVQTNRVATGGDDGFCRVSDLNTGTCVTKLAPTESEGYGLRCVLSDQSNVITLADASGRLSLWDRRGGTPVALGEHTDVANRGIARDSTSIYSLGGRRAQVLKWDARKPGEPIVVGKHQEAGVALAVCARGVLSASKDGGVALWDAASCTLLDELRAPGKKPTALSVVDNVVYACGSDRVVRVWEAGSVLRPPGPRPCCDCEGSGRKTLPSGSTCICVACFGSGKSPVDHGDSSDESEDGVETRAPPPPELTKPVDQPKTQPKVPSWLTKLTAVGALKAPAKPKGAGGLDVRSTRFQNGSLVVLAASLPDAQSIETLKRRGGADPSIRGNEVGEVKADDRSRVPYEVRGPRATTSWFEAAQLAACPPERAVKGKAALQAAKAPAPPKPPVTRPKPVASPAGGADAAFMNFRGPSQSVPGGTAVAPRANPKTKAERAAQRAADDNVDASLAQYMAQREAKKAAGGRKPVSDRLKKLRGGG